MAPLTATQRVWRSRVETLIGLAAPALDLLLVAGERLSRVVAPDDDWEPPVRPPDRRAPAPPSQED